MTLRHAALTYILVLALVALAGDYLANRYVVIRGFEDLERMQVEADARRARNELVREVEDLSRFLIDWSSWDDTHRFASQGNPEFVDSNLPIETYLDQSLNGVFIFDTEGRLRYGGAVDTEGSFNDALHQTLLGAIRELGLATHLGEAGRAGYVMLPDGPAQFAARPILFSDNSGPPGGTLVMVKLLTGDVVEAVSQRLELDVSVHEVSSAPLARDNPELLERLTASEEPVVRVRDEDTIMGYSLVRDITGQPALLIQVREDRSVTRHGRAVAKYNTFFLAVVISAFGLLLFLLLQRRVIARVEDLNTQVKRTDISTSKLSQVSVQGHDGIAELAANINRMLQRIAADQYALREARDKLEDKVAERTAELERANRELRKLDTAKTHFISATSHELRTPLTAIQGFIKLMERHFRRRIMPLLDMQGDTRKHVDAYLDNFTIIGKETARLQRTTDELLDLNLIEAGRMEWRDEEVDVAELVEDAVVAMSGRFMEKPSVDLRMDIAEGLPPLHVDRDRLHQVLLNLLSNGVKFTDEGSVHVTVEMLGDDEMLFTVKDTGRGIHQDELSDIFKVLYQGMAEQEYTDKPTGTGLGLTLSKEIVEHYNGRIWAESAPGEGSRFHFVIPVSG